MTDDVVLNKAAIIERCVQRVIDEYGGEDANLFRNQTKQDAIILNLQRACEASIDLAMYVISKRRLGVPQDSRHAFALLNEKGLIPADLTLRMQHMVGFRNIAVHEYTRLDLNILRSIVSTRLDDFRLYSSTIMKTVG
jgi:uncharacterized protein YutE (UPF0331/DUF86 family)